MYIKIYETNKFNVWTWVPFPTYLITSLCKYSKIPLPRKKNLKHGTLLVLSISDQGYSACMY
jgi:hypothetical protein